MKLRERLLDRCEPLVEYIADAGGDFYGEVVLPLAAWTAILAMGLWGLFWRHVLVAAAVGGALWWVWRWSA